MGSFAISSGANLSNPSQIATMQFNSKMNPNTGPMPNFQLPDWLNTDPNSIAGELMKQYSGAGRMFDPTGIAKAYNKNIDTTMGMGGQIADNAMREAIARAGQEGGGTNSAMVKAQTMLPVYEATGNMRRDKALAVADVRQRQAQFQGQLASALGQLRTSYLGMLAQSYLGGQKLSNDWAMGSREMVMRQQQMDWQRRMQEDAMRASGGGGGGGGGGSGVAPFQGLITRAPNNSGMGKIEYTPEYIEYLRAAGMEDRIRKGAPQYNQNAGVLGGMGLDLYNSQWRQMLSDSTGGAIPAYNFGTSDSANARAMGGMYAAPSQQNINNVANNMMAQNKLNAARQQAQAQALMGQIGNFANKFGGYF